MQLLQRLPGRRGVELTLRPACPDDAAALGALIESLPPRDRRLRFHGAVNGLADSVLRRWTTPDSKREVALVVAARTGTAEVLAADARYSVDGTGEAAEFGLVVAPAWRRLGVGMSSMQALRAAARRGGVRWLYGSVLAENAPMLALLRRCGFVVARSRLQRGLMIAEARVDVAEAVKREGRLFAAIRPFLRVLPRHHAAA